MSRKTKTTATKEEATPALVPKLRFPEFREAGKWQEKRIGQVCKSFSGGTPNTVQKEFYGGSIPFIRSAEIDRTETELFLTEEGLRNSAAKLVGKGDVLVALYGANSGDVALARIDGAINQAILCLKSDRSNSFIYQFLSLKKTWIIKTYLQGGQGNLSGEIVKSISLGFPSPAEQQKIAECLSSVDELLAAQARKVDALKTHKKGLMQQLFPREGETQPRLRFPEFQNAGEWETKRVDERGNVLAGKALAVNALGPLRPYLRTKNVLDGAIDLSDVLTMPMTDAEFSRFEILDGDILLNEGQSLELVGRASIYRGEFGGRVAMQNALLRFRAFPSTCPEFAAQTFQQCQKDGTFASIATQTTSVAHLGSSRFSALELSWPSLPEQQRIASCLSSLDALITAETQKHEALKTHKKGLMQQLFPSPEEVEV